MPQKSYLLVNWEEIVFYQDNLINKNFTRYRLYQIGTKAMLVPVVGNVPSISSP